MKYPTLEIQVWVAADALGGRCGQLYHTNTMPLSCHQICVSRHRDFTGTLGLAWMGKKQSERANGGVCQAQYQSAKEKGLLSLNTGFTTSMSFASVLLACIPCLWCSTQQQGCLRF